MRRGEEVPEDDDLVIKMTEACNAYEELIRPHLTIEQLAQLDD